jgi:branched-chain amino acid transport system permease protein
MTFWVLLTVNSVTFGGLLFLLSAGFSLIFGLMRIPNLTHGSMFMAGAYVGATLLGGELSFHLNFWLAAVVAALAVAAVSALMERFLLRRLAGQQLAQVLVTLGVSLMVADLCLMIWGGDPISVANPAGLGGFVRIGAAALPLYRMAVIAIAAVFAVGLWLMLERTRLGAMIRRVRARRRPCGLRRHDRRPDSVGLSRPRSGHAAARLGGRHPRRHRKPARLVRRQHHHRVHL